MLPEIDLSVESPHIQNQLSYRRDIDGLRAIAVLSVVIYHAFPNYLPGGFVGVDIFFVISGYLISNILYREKLTNSFSIQKFYERRIKRIFPALILVLTASYAYGWFHLMAPDYAQLGKHIAAGAGFVANLAFWMESGYFDADAITKPLLHLWSLGIEEQFYIAWPLLVNFFFLKNNFFKRFLLVLFATSLVIALYLTSTKPMVAFYAPWSRFWELLIGALLAYYSVSNDQSKKIQAQTQAAAQLKSNVITNPLVQNDKLLLSETIAWIGLSLIVLALFFITANDPFPGWRALLPTLGAAALIYSGPSTKCHRWILSNPLSVGIGLISYPLYLWHWPMLSLAFHTQGDALDNGQRLFLMIGAIILAYLTYQWIEKPIRFSKQWQKIKVICLLFLMGSIGFVGWNCYQRDGIEMRHREFMNQFSSYHYDKVVEQRQHVCFLLDESDDIEHFTNDCISKKIQISQDTLSNKNFHIILWGDSHGGSIAPGFRKLEAENPNIAFTQFTVAGCGGELPQLVASDFCQRANQKALDLILKIKPNVVVLHKGWGNDIQGVQQHTLKLTSKLAEYRIPVLVIGPVPTWNEDLPGLMYRYWKKNHRLPSEYGKENLTEYIPQLDEYFAEFAKAQHIPYFSSYQELCNDRGCKRYWPDEKNALTAYDKSHISPPAANYLVRELAKRYWSTEIGH